MSSRNTILSAIRDASPAKVPRPPLPQLNHAEHNTSALLEMFIAAARGTSAGVIRTNNFALAETIATLAADSRRHVSMLGDEDENSDAPPHSFADTDLFTCRAELGVAENGAVWLPLSRLRHRAALFLATQVTILLDATAIVPDFHTAYEHIAPEREAYGVFVAGPSKTADIEQSLVVGAHGPKALTIVVIESS